MLFWIKSGTSCKFAPAKVQLEDCNIVFDNQIKAFDGFHTCHNIDEIIFRLKEFDEEISEFCRQNKVLPICPTIPAHDIFYSFKSDESFGKLYYNYEFLTDNEHLFANSIWGFICNIKIIDDV